MAKLSSQKRQNNDINWWETEGLSQGHWELALHGQKVTAAESVIPYLSWGGTNRKLCPVPLANGENLSISVSAKQFADGRWNGLAKRRTGESCVWMAISVKIEMDEKYFKKRELVGLSSQWRQQMHVVLLQANLTNQATLSCSAWMKL